jgi:hypothetical protein
MDMQDFILFSSLHFRMIQKKAIGKNKAKAGKNQRK